MGMLWFIFSEVMFFACFFGALFYVRVFSVPWLGGEGIGTFTNEMLWQGYQNVWPTAGPEQLGGAFQTIPAFGIPFLNTLILLTSGVTVTLAHHALKKDLRRSLVWWLAATVILGFVFVWFQIHEYKEAYQELGLTMGSGVYGSTFFMLTGFHGLHVTLGAIMLLVITLRCARGHFRPDQHFGFEAVAWYWHFVDVVWLALFIFVYVF
jgi:cytochrome c oxidase subunit 3